MVQKSGNKETDRFSAVVCPLNDKHVFTGKCGVTCCSLNITTAHGCIGLDLPELKLSVDEIAAYKGISLQQAQHMLAHAETMYQSMSVLQRMAPSSPATDTELWPYNDPWLEKPVDPLYALNSENFEKFRIPKSKLTFEQFKTFLEGHAHGRQKDCNNQDSSENSKDHESSGTAASGRSVEKSDGQDSKSPKRAVFAIVTKQKTNEQPIRSQYGKRP